MSRRKKIYEGKAKILYEGPEPGTLIQYFKDDATAFNAQKKGTISGKGVINNRVSEHVFTRLAHIGIPTHFIRRLNMREQLVRQVEIIPIEVVVRNVADMIEKHFADKPKDWAPLVYCWRGGKRSGTLTYLLREIGFDARQLVQLLLDACRAGSTGHAGQGQFDGLQLGVGDGSHGRSLLVWREV